MIKDLHLAYTLISTYTVTSAVADLVGMGIGMIGRVLPPCRRPPLLSKRPFSMDLL